MSDFYKGLRGTAQGLMASYGQDLTFVRSTAGAYDPATGTAASTETTFTLRGVVESYATREIDGDRILANDRKVMAAAGDTMPQVGDVVTIDGADGRVQSVGIVSPSGVVVAVMLQVRL